MRACASSIAVLSILALLGCGGGRPGAVAVRVGDATITGAEVRHWVSVMAAGDPPAAGTARARTLTEHALRFLISADWLAGEARERSLAISDAEVASAVAREQRAIAPSGEPELASILAATGETRADLALEAKARVAEAKLRRAALARAPAVTAAEVAAYYRRNADRFVVPELRTVLITNRKTAGAARQIMHEVAAGRSFATYSHRETFTVLPDVPATDLSRPLKLAIARARPGSLEGPVKAHVDDFVFEVTTIVPRRRRALGEVKASIAQQLAAARERQALTALASSWTAKWTARTDCRPAYVVELCRQRRGGERREPAFGLR